MSCNRNVAVLIDLNWPFKRHYEMFAGIRDYAEKQSAWQITPCSFPQYEITRGRQFDGIVGRITKECYVVAQRAGIPMVNVWIDSPVAKKVPGVQLDSKAAGRLAAEHLIIRGFRRLAHFGLKGSVDSRLHYEGVLEVAREHGYPCIRHVAIPGYNDKAANWTRFVDYVKQVQQEWVAPQGVVFTYDETCYAVSSICRSEGWKMPEELALIGCNNDHLICNAADPSISSIDRGDWNCGREAARLLDALMNGESAPRQILMMPPKELVVRRSTDFHAVSDPRVSRALSFMSANFSKKVSVPAIARFAGVGRQTLERGFQTHLGRTVNEELIRMRIAQLKRLLVESEESIKELSAKVGFGTTANMFPLFKRHTGMTPKEYRERHASPQPS